MKATFISLFTLLTGIAAATPGSQSGTVFKRAATCETDGDNVEAGQKCTSVLQDLDNHKDDTRTFGTSGTGEGPVGCNNDCSISITPDSGNEITLKVAEVLTDAHSILTDCAGDGTVPFSGSIHSGEGETGRTVEIYKAITC